MPSTSKSCSVGKRWTNSPFTTSATANTATRHAPSPTKILLPPSSYSSPTCRCHTYKYEKWSTCYDTAFFYVLLPELLRRLRMLTPELEDMLRVKGEET